MSQIQAVLFKKSKFNSSSEARKALKAMKIKPMKRVHITDKYYRYRINDPKKYKRMRIKKGKDFDLIIGFKK